MLIANPYKANHYLSFEFYIKYCIIDTIILNNFQKNKRNDIIMELFRYETHLHTYEASACGQVSAKEQVSRYKEAGYAGIIVTDHFFNGNTTVPSHLPWDKRISLFTEGYENAKEEGDKVGLSVFFGFETCHDGMDFLIYGIDKQWLLDHPEIMSWNVKEQYKYVKEAGGMVIHAHPFRERFYIKKIRLYPDDVDGVEVINIGNDNKSFDDRAEEYAIKHNLLMSAGTDSHGQEIRRSGVAFIHKLKDIKDFIDSIKANEQQLIRP